MALRLYIAFARDCQDPYEGVKADDLVIAMPNGRVYADTRAVGRHTIEATGVGTWITKGATYWPFTLHGLALEVDAQQDVDEFFDDPVQRVNLFQVLKDNILLTNVPVRILMDQLHISRSHGSLLREELARRGILRPYGVGFKVDKDKLGMLVVQKDELPTKTFAATPQTAKDILAFAGSKQKKPASKARRKTKK